MSADPDWTGWPGGYDRLVLDSVDSTLNEAERRFDALGGPCWILALEQTKARGRRGRDWVSPPGMFAATLILPLDETPDRIALRSFIAALALFDAFVATTGRPTPFSLKWPNDVLLNGGKVAGILLETVQRQGRVTGLSIGIGVNLADAPTADRVEAQALRPVSLLAETGAKVTPEEFLAALGPAYAAHEASFRAFGFDPIRRLWLDRAAKLGEPITARFADRALTGRFDTIDDAGRLVLHTETGPQAIAAADIFF